jgi:hypothetical protein
LNGEMFKPSVGLPDPGPMAAGAASRRPSKTTGAGGGTQGGGRDPDSEFYLFRPYPIASTLH